MFAYQWTNTTSKEMGLLQPVSTYRLQFNADFSFRDAEKTLTYLNRLGIRTLYASPVFQASSGSTHGYDITDPLRFNSGIGTIEDLESLIRALHRRGMGWLQDVVPNHMAFTGENPWIRELLVFGKASEYRHTFDLICDHPDPELLRGIMWPFLEKKPEEAIRDGELTLRFGKQGFCLHYLGHEWPVSIRALRVILESAPEMEVPGQLAGLVDSNPMPEGWGKRMEQLYGEYAADKDVKAYIDHCLETVNRRMDRMEELYRRLAYLPVHWKDTEQRINYRRFFTINGLICLNMQREEVFDRCHRLILEGVTKGWFDGLRIDHVDGLYNPKEYLERLRTHCGNGSWMVVEKILERNEELPGDWPVEGTTGYDFLSDVNNLLTRNKNGGFFLDHYRDWTGSHEKPEKIFLEKKRFILHHRMKGELDLLAHHFRQSGILNAGSGEWKEIREAIAAFLMHCPVYKIYHAPSEFDAEDRKRVRKIFRNAAGGMSGTREALSMLEQIWLGGAGLSETQKGTADHLFRRLMQFTGPLMAKGLEDTAYYAYTPFLAHNEVGDSPAFHGMTVKAFHRRMVRRHEVSPLTMNVLSTHDTKRGEDARARLNVVGDLPDPWKKASERWRAMNAPLKKEVQGKPVPRAADEYLIYQALVGHVPMDGNASAVFVERFKEYMLKALKESKEMTSWSDPDPAYENLTMDFITDILDPGHAFRESLGKFLEAVIPHGIVNSLTQTILKLTVPGIPDTYQGSETWNLSFVDPDNRRPVPFNRLSRDLEVMIRASGKSFAGLMEKLWKHPEDGRVKQWVTHLLLKERGKNPGLFQKGRYLPLKVKGKYRKHLVAFLRSYGDSQLLVALPLHTASMPPEHGWEKTRIQLPGFAPLHWKDLFSKNEVDADGGLLVRDLFRTTPFAVCSGIPNAPVKRAGILMHITSLPGPYGTGDFGPETYRFVDFLERTGQRVWQTLPLSPTSSLTTHSPYSSRSAFAGNILFIDPGQLAEWGLLDGRTIGKQKRPPFNGTDYTSAENVKLRYLDEAFINFRKKAPVRLQAAFGDFVREESHWLRDHALFEVLWSRFGQKPWHQWPQEYRFRNEEALAAFEKQHAETLERIRFGQFAFSKQWERLKGYANERGISIFGDIPIYIDLNSADAWANPGLFQLDNDHRPEAVAGVPPDYFNEEGQLWGMPLYDWDAMEMDGYDWWLKRIKKNLQWFDLLRLDHFRAFESYWKVPVTETTARNGQWVRGPGKSLFDAVRKVFPHMPFVAEDLGQITPEVYELRDRYQLPGMKVLQFGFDRKMAFSQHYPGNIPYHSIAYTGTHDNNTMKGWYRKEAGKSSLKRFRRYTGKKLTEKNVHREMIRLAYGSAARLVIIPLQDWLGLDENSRMNFPSTTRGNWIWRLDGRQLSEALEKKIRKTVTRSGRY